MSAALVSNVISILLIKQFYHYSKERGPVKVRRALWTAAMPEAANDHGR
jgi:hypothetical protein